MADLAPRGVPARSGPGDAYLTISGGQPGHHRAPHRRPGAGARRGRAPAPRPATSSTAAPARSPTGRSCRWPGPACVRAQRRRALRHPARLPHRDARGGRRVRRRHRQRRRHRLDRRLLRAPGRPGPGRPVAASVPAGALGKDLLDGRPAAALRRPPRPEVVDDRFVDGAGRGRGPDDGSERRRGAGRGLRPGPHPALPRRSSTSPATRRCGRRRSQHTDELLGRLMESVDLDQGHGAARRRPTTAAATATSPSSACAGPDIEPRLPAVGVDPAGRVPHPRRHRPHDPRHASAWPGPSTWRAARRWWCAVGRRRRRARRPPHRRSTAPRGSASSC